MKDWKGNEIKPGMTILKIAVKGMFDGGKIAAFNKNGEVIAYSKPLPRQYLWEVTAKCFVKPEGDTKIESTENEIEECKIGVDFLDFWFNPSYFEIIAIEGISDNKDEYYMNVFQ
jgi:hypothetical protein